jgi:hypothetical protein
LVRVLDKVLITAHKLLLLFCWTSWWCFCKSSLW